MIQLKGVSKEFPVRGLVLDHIDFEAIEGSTTAIVGPSGSGKTTLLNLIGLLEKADSGTISFLGEDVSGLGATEAARYRNRNIGFIFQEHLLLPHLTVRENILLPLLATDNGNMSTPDLDDYLLSLSERTGITNILNKYPFHISGGEAQRASFVRALINKPKLLLADEPTGSLDRRNGDNLADLLARLSTESGTTLIVVTHSDTLAMKMERQLEIVNGKLVQTKG